MSKQYTQIGNIVAMWIQYMLYAYIGRSLAFLDIKYTEHRDILGRYEVQ